MIPVTNTKVEGISDGVLNRFPSDLDLNTLFQFEFIFVSKVDIGKLQ